MHYVIAKVSKGFSQGDNMTLIGQRNLIESNSWYDENKQNPSTLTPL